jgi:hypothetical protein
MSSHADDFSGKVLRPLNTARRMNEDVPVAKLPMGKNGDRPEGRAAGDPAEKYSHLELAHVEFQVTRKAAVALLGRQGDDPQIDAFGLHGTIDQKARSIVFVAG